MRGHAAKYFSVSKTPLDVATLIGQIAPPVRHDAIGLDAATAALANRHGVAQVAKHDLDGIPRLAEDDRRYARAHEVGREHDGLLHVTRANPERLVHDGRIEKEKPALPSGGAALVDELHLALLDAEEPCRVLTRIPDGRRGADDSRAGPVKLSHSQEAPQHVGDVRAEDALVRVKFVDDDVAQVLEDPCPSGVVRKNARVQHVGVRQNDGRAVASHASRIAGSVSVVDDRPGREPGRSHELTQARFLVT